MDVLNTCVTSAYGQWIDYHRNCGGCGGPQYLYFKPGAVLMVAEGAAAPEGWELAEGSPYRADLTKERFYARAHATLYRLPILPTEAK